MLDGLDPESCVHGDGIGVWSVSLVVSCEEVDVGGSTARHRAGAVWQSRNPEDLELGDGLIGNCVSEDTIGVIQDGLRDGSFGCIDPSVCG